MPDYYLSEAPGWPRWGVAVILERRTKIERLAPATVATFGSIDQFEDRLVSVQNQVREAREMFENLRTPENRRALEAEYDKLASLQDGVRDLLLCADFVRVNGRYKGTL